MRDNKLFSLSGRVLYKLVLLVKWLLHRLHTGLANPRMRCWKEAGMLPLLLKPTGSTGFTTGTGYKSRTGLWNLNIWFRYHAYAPQADFHKVRRVPGNQSEALCWAVIANGNYNIPPGRSSFPSPSTNSWGSSGKYRSRTIRWKYRPRSVSCPSGIYFTLNQWKQRLKHKRIRCQIEIEQQFHVKVQMWIHLDQIHIKSQDQILQVAPIA